MKYLVLALCICVANAASFGAYTPYKPQPQVAQAVAQLVQDPVVAEAPVAAARTVVSPPVPEATARPVVPVVTPRNVAPVVTARNVVPEATARPVVPVVTPRNVAPVVTARNVVSEAKARPVIPVVTARNVVPVVTQRTVVPVVTQRTVVPVAKNVNTDEAHAAIVRLDAEIAPEGYNYAYETANGISAQSSGSLKKVDNIDVLTVQGSYQYVSPDGTPVRFVYVADENGYHPESDLLPVGPAIPEAILRSLEYIRAHPPKPDQY